MNTKHCRRCQRTLPVESFQRDRTARDGRQGRCRECNTAVCADYRSRNRDTVIAMSRRARQRNRQTILTRNAQWNAAHREARLAHQKVYRAVKSGLLPKPHDCPRCGRAGVRIEAHHHDYSRPLDVAWLCCICHANAFKAGETASSGERKLGA